MGKTLPPPLSQRHLCQAQALENGVDKICDQLKYVKDEGVGQFPKRDEIGRNRCRASAPKRPLRDTGACPLIQSIRFACDPPNLPFAFTLADALCV